MPLSDDDFMSDSSEEGSTLVSYDMMGSSSDEEEDDERTKALSCIQEAGSSFCESSSSEDEDDDGSDSSSPPRRRRTPQGGHQHNRSGGGSGGGSGYEDDPFTAPSVAKYFRHKEEMQRGGNGPAAEVQAAKASPATVASGKNNRGASVPAIRSVSPIPAASPIPAVFGKAPPPHAHAPATRTTSSNNKEHEPMDIWSSAVRGQTVVPEQEQEQQQEQQQQHEEAKITDEERRQMDSMVMSLVAAEQAELQADDEQSDDDDASSSDQNSHLSWDTMNTKDLETKKLAREESYRQFATGRQQQNYHVPDNTNLLPPMNEEHQQQAAGGYQTQVRPRSRNATGAGTPHSAQDDYVDTIDALMRETENRLRTETPNSKTALPIVPPTGEMENMDITDNEGEDGEGDDEITPLPPHYQLPLAGGNDASKAGTTSPTATMTTSSSSNAANTPNAMAGRRDDESLRDYWARREREAAEKLRDYQQTQHPQYRPELAAAAREKLTRRRDSSELVVAVLEDGTEVRVEPPLPSGDLYGGSGSAPSSRSGSMNSNSRSGSTNGRSSGAAGLVAAAAAVAAVGAGVGVAAAAGGGEQQQPPPSTVTEGGDTPGATTTAYNETGTVGGTVITEGDDEEETDTDDNNTGGGTDNTTGTDTGTGGATTTDGSEFVSTNGGRASTLQSSVTDSIHTPELVTAMAMTTPIGPGPGLPPAHAAPAAEATSNAATSSGAAAALTGDAAAGGASPPKFLLGIDINAEALEERTKGSQAASQTVSGFTSTIASREQLTHAPDLHRVMSVNDWTALDHNLLLLGKNPGFLSTSLTATDDVGATPLHTACWKAPPPLSLHMISLLPRIYQDMQRICLALDCDGNTALHLCAANTCMENQGRSQHASNHEYNDFLGDLEFRSVAGFKETDVLEALVLSAPEAATMQNNEGDTPLHLAVSSPLSSVLAVSILLDANVDVCLTQDIAGSTPLHAAIANQVHEEVLVRLLISAPRSALIPDHKGLLPLHYVAAFCHTPFDFVMKLVAANKAGVLATTEDGDTPLHLAISNAQSDDELTRRIVQSLLGQPGGDMSRSPLSIKNKAKLDPLECCDAFDAPQILKQILTNHLKLLQPEKGAGPPQKQEDHEENKEHEAHAMGGVRSERRPSKSREDKRRNKEETERKAAQEEENRRKKQEERRKKKEEAKRKAEEEAARAMAAEAEAQRKLEEAARVSKEEDRLRKDAEEAAHAKKEEERRRKETEETARVKKEEERRLREAEEMARVKEEEERRRKEDEERRRKDEDRARRRADEERRRKEEEKEAKRKAKAEEEGARKEKDVGGRRKGDDKEAKKRKKKEGEKRKTKDGQRNKKRAERRRPSEIKGTCGKIEALERMYSRSGSTKKEPIPLHLATNSQVKSLASQMSLSIFVQKQTNY